jgi:hypothetical protein
MLQRLAGQPLGWDSTLPWDHPAEWDGRIGFPLGIDHAAWIAGLVATYPLCAAYAAYRRAHPEKRWLTFF